MDGHNTVLTRRAYVSMQGRTFEIGFLRSTLSNIRPKTFEYCLCSIIQSKQAITVRKLCNANETFMPPVSAWTEA